MQMTKYCYIDIPIHIYTLNLFLMHGIGPNCTYKRKSKLRRRWTTNEIRSTRKWVMRYNKLPYSYCRETRHKDKYRCFNAKELYYMKWSMWWHGLATRWT